MIVTEPPQPCQCCRPSHRRPSGSRHFRIWPFSEVRQRPLSRRCWRTSGHHARLLLAADFMSTHPSRIDLGYGFHFSMRASGPSRHLLRLGKSAKRTSTKIYEYAGNGKDQPSDLRHTAQGWQLRLPNGQPSSGVPGSPAQANDQKSALQPANPVLPQSR